MSAANFFPANTNNSYLLMMKTQAEQKAGGNPTISAISGNVENLKKRVDALTVQIEIASSMAGGQNVPSLRELSGGSPTTAASGKQFWSTNQVTRADASTAIKSQIGDSLKNLSVASTGLHQSLEKMYGLLLTYKFPGQLVDTKFNLPAPEETEEFKQYRWALLKEALVLLKRDVEAAKNGFESKAQGQAQGGELTQVNYDSTKGPKTFPGGGKK